MMTPRKVLIFLLLAWLGEPASARPHVVLPADAVNDPRGITAFKAALEQKNDADAAALLDALFRDDGDQLMASDEGGLISIGAWVESLAAPQRAALTTAYREKFDVAARTQLDALRRATSARPEDFVAFARQHPFSASCAAAEALGAERFLALGDVWAAHSMYQLALRGGWTPEGAQATQVDLLRRLHEGKLHLDAGAATRPAGGAFTGALPFDAPWLDWAEFAGQPRFFPYAAGDRIYLSSWHGVAAVKENGQVAWQTQATLPTVNVPPRRPPAPGDAGKSPEPPRRPAYHEPGVLADVYGRAQILVARQLTAQAAERDRDYCLRAYRADDGKLLWSSENQAYLKDMTFAGAPAVCGQYTYAVALSTPPANDAPGDQGVSLLLVALDTLTGEFRWQTTLCRFTLTVQERGAWGNARPWDAAWEQGEPLVSGDAVYVTPNAGFAAAAERFEGKLRWVRPYATIGGETPLPPRTKADLQREVEGRRQYFDAAGKGGARPAPPAVNPALGERWRGTPVLCGEVLVAAPQDTVGVHGIDALSGRVVWSRMDIEVPTLIGQTDKAAIFAGNAVTAIDVRSGASGWRWEAPRGSRITGPAVVRGGEVLVPTMSGIITVLRAEDGSVLKESPAVPSFRRLINADGVRRVLDDVGVGKAFGLPLP